MRSIIASAMAVFVVGLLGAPAFAQDTPAPAPASLPFPAGARFGFVDLQRILAGSTEGQAASAKVQELTEQKVSELEGRNQQLQGEITAKNTELQELQQNLAQGETVMSTEALLSLQREISRLQLDTQRQTQDAQAEMERITQDAEGEVADLRQQLQIEFEQKLQPAIDEVATETGLDFLFGVGQGMVWANRSLDLTQVVIDKLNSTDATPPQ